MYFVTNDMIGHSQYVLWTGLIGSGAIFFMVNHLLPNIIPK